MEEKPLILEINNCSACGSTHSVEVFPLPKVIVQGKDCYVAEAKCPVTGMQLLIRYS